MTKEQTIARIERVIWVLIYIGLFLAIVGIASRSASPSAAWSLIAIGGVLAVVGVVLILVRSRMSEPD